MGSLYAIGKGVKQDYAEAFRLYRNAAMCGHPQAQYNVGFMFEKGTGVKQDYFKAVEWYRKSAMQNNSDLL